MSFQSRLGHTSSNQFKSITDGMSKVRNSIETVLEKIGEFKILDERLVPYGLKPIARSISWLVEQIIVQNLKRYKDECGLISVKDPPHALAQYDCIIKPKDDEQREYYVNIKTSLSTTNESGNFDISKAPKLVQLYEQIPELVLLVVIARVSIKGVWIKFEKPTIFNVAWVPQIYYNRANHNLQSTADGTQFQRTNDEFVAELKGLMDRAGHLNHY
jgi:hypothetical protein